MIIKIPENNIPERTYIIDILVGEFLGLPYSIEVSNNTDYQLLFEDKKVVFKDQFFNCYPEKLSYLKIEAIPESVAFVKNQFTPESDIPVLFGNDQLIVDDNYILSGIDVFAASFFMLTRWEEYVNPTRDIHNRFSAKNSLAYKFSFLNRPIVNEYVEMIWGMLMHLGYTESRKEWKYEFVLTHDVDVIQYHKGIGQLIKRIGGHVLKRKSPLLAIQNMNDYLRVKAGMILDPYDTFSWIMDLSERSNIRSRFYFMSGGVTSYDNHYNIEDSNAKIIINEVKRRGHIIGFHPSYNAYNDPIQWKKEKEKLEQVVGQKVTEGRQHYLRFEASKTWRIWNDNEIKRDLTLSYADKEGFRCGVCYDFSVYDFLNEKKLVLKEIPLIVMEASFITYQDITPNEMLVKTHALLETVKKYRGKFVFLWHNSSFNVPSWEPYQQVYKEIIRSS